MGWLQHRQERAAKLRYSVTARGSGREILQRAVGYFGPNGLGLKVRANLVDAVHFDAPDGFVSVTITGEDPTQVELTTREYDHHVQRFIRELA